MTAIATTLKGWLHYGGSCDVLVLPTTNVFLDLLSIIGNTKRKDTRGDTG